MRKPVERRPLLLKLMKLRERQKLMDSLHGFLGPGRVRRDLGDLGRPPGLLALLEGPRRPDRGDGLRGDPPVITCPECGGDVKGLVHGLGCWALGAEFLKGHRAGLAEIFDDGWTASTARRYLALVGAPTSQFDRGYQAAIRELLRDQPGTPSPGGSNAHAPGGTS